MKPKSHPKLGPALRDALVQKAGSLASAAETLGLSDSSLRVWLKRSRFPETELLELVRYAGLGQDLATLADGFEFTLTGRKRTPFSAEREIRKGTASLSRALSLMDSRVDQFGRLYRQFGEDVRLLFGSMGPGDLFVYLSLTEYPYEMAHSGWSESGRLIANAATNGARFVYLHPTDPVAETLRRIGIIAIPPTSEYLQRFETFRADVCALALESGSANRLADIRARVIAVPSPDGAFLVPGHKYVLFKPSNGPARALARFPTGSNEKQLALHLPLDQNTTDQFVSFVVAALAGHSPAISELLRASNVQR